MDEWKRRGQIPAFGEWDLANQLPITQYFECATQAHRDLYALHFHIPPSPLKKAQQKRRRRRRRSNVKENEKMKRQRQGKVWDVRPNGKREGLPRPKPVDEDLYHIPPHLLPSSNRGKLLRFFSKCLPPCGCLS